jgi:hypothetical protein
VPAQELLENSREHSIVGAAPAQVVPTDRDRSDSCASFVLISCAGKSKA